MNLRLTQFTTMKLGQKKCHGKEKYDTVSLKQVKCKIRNSYFKAIKITITNKKCV